ncbi:MAG: HipA domain-containing protein, partial [Bacilli bacterium]|nr:HipA domain-containing protein [Bacilli bacterium]
LEKLSYLGEDGLGALFYSPTKSLLREQEEDYEKLALAAMHFCEEKKDVDIDALFQNAGSSGGARPKAHLLIEGEEWIVKFWERKDPLSLGRMEYDYALAAKACGIPISDCRLLPSSCCEGYFATKRFDRKGGRRLHVLSLGGFLESPHFLPNLDYVTFLQSTAFLTRSNKEVLKAYRLACFNVFAQNRDDHSKNFSFLYDEEKRSYVLAPAYDLTFTPNIKEHEMTCCGNGNPGEDDLFALAETMSIPKENAEKAIKGIKEIVESKLGKWIRGNS